MFMFLFIFMFIFLIHSLSNSIDATHHRGRRDLYDLQGLDSQGPLPKVYHNSIDPRINCTVWML